MVTAQIQALQDQLCKICTSDDSSWQDLNQQNHEQINREGECNKNEDDIGRKLNDFVEKKANNRTCGRTEEVSARSTDPFSTWNTEEKEKLLLCVAKIFQIQFPLYTAYKHNTHATIEV